MAQRRVFQRRMLAWGRRNFCDYPWRRSSSAWASLAAEILLQRTRADQVVPVYSEFMDKYPEPGMLAREKPRDLLKLTGALGLRWRAPLLIETAKRIDSEGRIRDEKAWLLGLPGVGPYASAAYLSLHRGKRDVIIDSNVVRLLGRVFGFRTDGETRRKKWLEVLADTITPRRAFRDYNYAVLDLAMNVCRPSPKCAVCPLSSDLCASSRCRSDLLRHRLKLPGRRLGFSGCQSRTSSIEL